MTTHRPWGQPLPGPLDVDTHDVDLTEARHMLTVAVDGLPLGRVDRQYLAWLAGWDQPTMAVLASVLWRARLAPVPR